ncbi:LOB domain-containing protein 41 [Abeliophyllum distichum]|uniref:LOB domain-containing protein 41 n=1 Tax=Abeliophyllum distichum TaxID=126358 RepID=A0ABD1U238_9LAMI
MSCNGCRVLRKGCSGDCTLRPCLQWIKSPESQANATLFLAKFYGRAGLVNLINSGPDNLRPEIFRSLLYEACGRIINPIYGSVGLMWSGNWHQCQEAVEAVLKGAPLMQVSSTDEASATQAHSIMPFQGCDIRHLSKNSATETIHRVRTRKRSARQMNNPLYSVAAAAEFMTESEDKFTITGWDCGEDYKDFVDELKRAPSHDSFSVETVEPSLLNPGTGIKPDPHPTENNEIGLELTLGFNPVVRNHPFTVIELSDSVV